MVATSNFLAELDVEEAALEWFAVLGYEVLHGGEIGPEQPHAERTSFQEAVLPERLRSAVARLNPQVPIDAQEEAIRKALRRSSPSLVLDNRAFHRMLVEGVEVAYTRADGRVVGDRVHLIDFEQPDANDWVVVNQLTLVEGQATRRPDVVVFVNGLPLAVFELKDMTDEQATIWSAFNQLQTYKQQIPVLLVHNEVLVISDGANARLGSLTSDRERFMPWRTITGEDLAPATLPQLQVLIEGVFEPRRFLEYLRHFVVFEDDGATVQKKLAAYHQFHAVRRAVGETVRASAATGNHRVGVVWHTQGSGKSLTMAFYAGEIIAHPAMRNPTLVVLTDRNDLDDQLFTTFSHCQELLRQTPVQAQDRGHLRKLLHVASGGVIFTTIQKFLPDEKGDQHPLLSDRSNVVVIADEAHRSQYGFVGGFARHIHDALPHASFIGFTGTPIEEADRSTRAIFGDYISVYDVQQAVEDGATVPIYYESRLAKLALNEDERPHLDADFDEVTEGEEAARKERLKSKWAALEAVVGTDRRLGVVAQDLVEHFEKRLDGMEGKGLIVGMSRRICVDLYRAITALRPEWHAAGDEAGAIKVVMTGSASDPLDWQPHIRNKAPREGLATRFKDPDDPLKLVIVRDMWLTGFDVPCLHTMYVDKPMRSHGLMQAIARVNRVFRDKPGGLVVDYLGLADFLRKALAEYTRSGGRGEEVLDQAEAVAVFLERYEVVASLFHGFDYTPSLTGSSAGRLGLATAGAQFILAQADGKERLLKLVSELSKAFALAVPHEETLRLRDEVAFFQAVRATLVKTTVSDRTDDDLNHAVRQLVAKAVAPAGVVDVFSAAGLPAPDISILSDEFLAEVRELPQKNLAVEVLRKLLNDELKVQAKRSVVQARLFSQMLERTLRAYQNRALTAAEIIEQLIELAKQMQAAEKRGESLGLSDEELAFYDALLARDDGTAPPTSRQIAEAAGPYQPGQLSNTAERILGDESLREIARELVDTVKRNTAVDWMLRESARAKLRLVVKRVLRKHGYPPEEQDHATVIVLQQAELFAERWLRAA